MVLAVLRYLGFDQHTNRLTKNSKKEKIELDG